MLAAKNALQWDFPGGAVAVPLSVFKDEDFLTSLATFLQQASLEATKSFAAHAFKAGTMPYETRDTPRPTIICSMLLAILEENGRRIPVTRLRKRVRDDVCWDNADKPWRRLPYWLVLRVALGRYLALTLGPEAGRAEYKFYLCLFLSKFLDSVQNIVTIEQLDLLRRKICRRMVKLDVDQSHAPDKQLAARFNCLAARVSPKIEFFIIQSTDFIEKTWETFKNDTKRKIPALPRTASPRDLKMSLRCSGTQLRDILKDSKVFLGQGNDDKKSLMKLASLKIKTGSNQDDADVMERNPVSEFAEPFYELAKWELACERLCFPSNDQQDSLGTVSTFATSIGKYIAKAIPLSEGNVEQMSVCILGVMELWMRMDEQACQEFSLLREYCPLFYPEMLNGLYLLFPKDMRRLQDIQTYLQKRVDGCGGSRRTIFADPDSGCFGDRYVEESHLSAAYYELLEEIESAAADSRKEKKEEWLAKSEEFDDLSKRINEGTCLYMTDDSNPTGKDLHEPRLCPRCRLIHQLEKLRIQIYEHPLPSDETHARVVAFELMCPPAFAAYRDATWKIVWRLATEKQEGGIQARCTLQSYSELQPWAHTRSEASAVTLGSTTKSCRFNIRGASYLILILC